jgi:hypothetical protein
MVLFRNHSLFLLIALTFCTCSCAQTKADYIKAIEKEVQAINSENTFQKIVLENQDFLENNTDGGSELTGYYKGGQIKKIKQWVGLSNGNEIKEFYFKNGHLIFVHEQFLSFVFDNKKEQFDLTKTEKTFDGRYYFNNKKLIESMATGHNRFEDDTIDPEKTLLAEAMDYLMLLNKK